MWILNKLFLKFVAFAILLVIFYYCLLSNSVFQNEYNIFQFKNNKNITNIYTPVNKTNYKKNINIWCIFTKVTENAPLQFKFQNLVKSLLAYSSIPLHIHVISDNFSKHIAIKILDDAVNNSVLHIIYSFYDVKISAKLISDIVQTMTPHFSSQPGTYYSDALFYLSLGLHRIAPTSEEEAIMLDCDVKFTKDVALLYQEFDRFNSSNLFGMTYELTPVYRHALYSYRLHRNTSFGDYVHDKPVTSIQPHIFGFPGYNSGVVLFNLSAIRKSTRYSKIISETNVKRLIYKYKFKGHLGDQDFYTLLGYESPELFHTLPCNFNRQLCVWWRDHGYRDIFGNYSKCDGDIIIYHGNCNTPIPV